MAHLRIYLHPETYDRLREISARTGREAWVEAGLLLDAAIRGRAQSDNQSALTSVSIKAAQTRDGRNQ